MSLASLVEIFSSVQGEGPYVGTSTIFVRFGGCDLRCGWCDSPGTWRRAPTARFESRPGCGVFREVDNPVPFEALMSAIEALDTTPHRFVSLTGGEPLLQPEAVGELAAWLRASGRRVYLETHGLAVEGLREVVREGDVVSMDWKLASDVRREGDLRGSGEIAPFHDVHAAFLGLAAERAEVFVKLVVTNATRDDELDEVCARIADVAPGTTLVVQPVTPYGRVREAPPAERLLACHRRCEARLAGRVLLIPQTHRMIGAL